MWFTTDLFRAIANNDLRKFSTYDLNSILKPINSQHYVQKIAEIRRRFVDCGAKAVFEKWRILDNHAYTYNKGARSELQSNIGIRAKGIRLGYGFNLTGGGFGEPPKTYKILKITMSLLQDYNSVTSKIWKTLSPLYVEYDKKTVLLDIFGTTISSLKLVPPGFQVYNN